VVLSLLLLLLLMHWTSQLHLQQSVADQLPWLPLLPPLQR
jgi:hypothetical protein